MNNRFIIILTLSLTFVFSLRAETFPGGKPQYPDYRQSIGFGLPLTTKPFAMLTGYIETGQRPCFLGSHMMIILKCHTAPHVSCLILPVRPEYGGV